VILLQGTGTTGPSGSTGNFAVAVGASSATVVAGNTASVLVGITSVAGFSSPVTIGCSGLPPLSSCSATPATVTPTSTGVVTTTLQISTTRRTAAPPGGLPRLLNPGLKVYPAIWLLLALLVMSAGTLAALRRRVRWNWAVLAITALWLAAFAACGAGGKGYVNPTGTPAGTYTVTVTGTSSGLTHSTTITLIVQ
jgi:uncharacterized protein